MADGRYMYIHTCINRKILIDITCVGLAWLIRSNMAGSLHKVLGEALDDGPEVAGLGVR